MQGSWKTQLKQKFRNGRRDNENVHNDDDDDMPSASAPPKKKAHVETDTVDDSEYEENLQKLDKELEKERPSRVTVRQLMKLTVDGRHKWIQDKQRYYTSACQSLLN
jgi:hypothetical protein